MAGREGGRNWRIVFVAALLLGALLLSLLGLTDPSGRWRPWIALLAPEEDGSWLAVTIDGRPAEGFRVSITGGRVAGGRDGCNDWAFAAPDPSGGRTIDTILVACPEDDPLRESYWRLVQEGHVALRGDGRLRLAGDGHQALFRRCAWRTERIHNETRHSETRVCAPV
ncbi:hypothetical protein E2493_04505 [Sphingomonas parva]|uniref:META domain-containing protein n=1 Tax=Sphingomonas parva TaxID=2555898 RepID=A0A4Y8ZTU2_9SPHN|nr:hypothetical protein [Sphingomonas parva]TFI59458.1 hypothetical protein E2493_04505 [Sphingomonas parva]